MMKMNIGITDKWVRIFLGILAIAAGVYLKTWWGSIGLILLLTAFIQICPLYLPFGLSTRKTKETSKA